MSTINAEEIKAVGTANTLIVDVRSPAEFSAVHAAASVNLPLEQFNAQRLAELKQVSGVEHVLLMCASGKRASMACGKLDDTSGVQVMEGGMTAWEASGLPVVKGRGVISIERQVRIVAGLLVATGAALGFWVHPAWIGLSAFVGVGLTFAGITDFCGMGLVLAKMPWNRRSACCTVEKSADGQPPQAKATA